MLKNCIQLEKLKMWLNLYITSYIRVLQRTQIFFLNKNHDNYQHISLELETIVFDKKICEFMKLLNFIFLHIKK